MRQFNFKLQRLLSYRKLLTEQAKGFLAGKVGELQAARNESNELREIRNRTKEYRDKGLKTGMHAFQAVNLHEHLLRIDETVRFANEKTEKARIEVSAATEKLVEKRKEEEILKTLKKRRFDAWTRDYYRDEGKTLDDIATVKYLKDRKEQ